MSFQRSIRAVATPIVRSRIASKCSCISSARFTPSQSSHSLFTRSFQQQEKKDEAADAKAEPAVDHKKLIAELEAKNKETYDRLLRTAAEMENVRRLAKNEAESARKYAVTGFAKNLLEVADTLELAGNSAIQALQAVKAKSTSNATTELGDEYVKIIESLVEGIQMTEKVLLKSFESQGVTKFDAMGQKFDPNVHHGLYQIDDDTLEPHTVAQVMKHGYKISDRVLRAAQVGTVRPKSQ